MISNKAMEKLFCSYLALVIIIGSICIAGWGMNIFKLVQCDFEEPYKAEVIRIIGVVVPPVGVVTGFLDLGE